MTRTTLLLSAALAGVLTAGAAMAEDAAAPAPTTVKCYGIAKAGQNACANATGTHSCKGMSTADNDPSEFVESAAEDCEKSGGKTTPPEAAPKQ